MVGNAKKDDEDKETEMLYVAPRQEPVKDLRQELNWEENDYYFQEEESGLARWRRKIGGNPFVPVGTVLTTVVLGFGVWTMKTKNRSHSQALMRARVFVQGATVFSLVAGVIYQRTQQLKNRPR